MVSLNISTGDKAKRHYFADRIREALSKRLHCDMADVSSEEIITAALCENSLVQDCVVLRRRNKDSLIAWVTYFVPSTSFSVEHLQSYLIENLPPELVPKYYVPISVIPTNDDGAVDEIALSSLEVIDEGLLQRWETELQQLPGIEQVAVVPNSRVTKPSVLHLSELLPNWQKSTHTTVEASLTSDVMQTDTAEKKLDADSRRPAIANGGDLPQEAYELRTLPEILRTTVGQENKSRITYVALDGSEYEQSYNDLLLESEQVLAGLKALGLKPQDKVIFQLELPQDIIPAFWGCILGGFIPVIMSLPSSFQDLNSAIEKICNVWKLLEHPLILTNSAKYASVQSLSQWLKDAPLTVGNIDELKTYEPFHEHHISKPDDLAFFNLTSGSTGMPKCIGLTHWNLISRSIGTNILCKHTNEDVILNWLPFDHIGSISDWHIRCVLLGCSLIYTVKEYVLGDPLRWLKLISHYRITHSWAPNFAYALVNEALRLTDDRPNWNLSCVKTLLTAGEAVSSNAVEEFVENLSEFGFKKTAISPAFGMAEMGSGITYYQPTDSEPIVRHIIDKSSLKGQIKRVSLNHPSCSVFTDLGTAIPGISVRIVDHQDQLLEEDTIGRLQVKGDAVSPGYYKNSSVNKQVFLPDGWFDTGDLGFISNEHLVVTGRAKETIIINGANYYNHEIEAVVEKINGIEVAFTAACAVQSVDDSTEKLAIFFHANDLTNFELGSLIKTVRQTVVEKVGVRPDYLLPLEREDIPKTAIGKIQRSKLAKMFEQGDFQDTLKRVDILVENENTLPNWFYKKVWQPKEILIASSSYRRIQRAIIFMDSLGMGEQVCKCLELYEIDTIVVNIGTSFEKVSDSVYILDPLQEEQYQRLVKSIHCDCELPPSHIFHLWDYCQYRDSPTKIEELEDRLLISTNTVLYTIKALSRFFSDASSTRIIVASSFVHQVLETDKLEVEKSVVLGILKSASQEFPSLNCIHVDLIPGHVEKDTKLLLEEAESATLEREVAYRNDKRFVARLEAIDWLAQPQQNLPFEDSAVYVITGGLGGIGFHVASYLLENFNAKLLLLGSTNLPKRDSWDAILSSPQNGKVKERIQTYLALEKLKGDIFYEAIDVGDFSQLAQAVQYAEKYWKSPVKGAIHLAGNAPERLLIDETAETLAMTFRAKIRGTWNLHQLVKGVPGSIFISFSSLAGFFSGAMIGAYSAASTYLDYFACFQKSSSHVKGYSFAWAMWDDVGLSRGSRVKELLLAKGFVPVTPQQGIYSLIAGLQTECSCILTGLNQEKQNVNQYLKTDSLQMQRLYAYYSGDCDPIFLRDLRKVNIKDSFNTLTTIFLQQLRQIPKDKNGKPDLELLLRLVESERESAQLLPRNFLEKRLSEIWKGVLGKAQIFINDNFFELGGSSLKAARLFAVIEDEYGVSLPLETIITSPTIDKLASIISAKEEVNLRTSLVAIQTEGEKPPFFCIPPAAMTVVQFKPLSNYMGMNYPFYAFQPLGMDGRQKPQETVELMANTYISELKRVQPNGPYFIGGQCFGGIVAFEMAQQLLRDGDDVALLALIDTQVPPNATLDIWGEDASNKLLNRFLQIARYGKRKLSKLVNSLIARTPESRHISVQEQNIQNTFDAHRRARLAYKPLIYPGKITMFMSIENNPEHTDMHPEFQFRWIELTNEGIDFQLIPGDHLEITQDAGGAKVLAQKLAFAIDMALQVQE